MPGTVNRVRGHPGAEERPGDAGGERQSQQSLPHGVRKGQLPCLQTMLVVLV